MELSVKYLGLTLAHPLMTGASPFVDDLDRVKRLEDAGASAITMHSLFEEQISGEEVATVRATETHANSSGEASSYLPDPPDFHLGPDEYLEQLRKLKKAVRVPVIASLNGTTRGGWLRYAKLMQEAGADALELNVYDLATDVETRGDAVEDRMISVVKAVKKEVSIPVAVKLSPFYSSLANLAGQLDQAGVDGLVLFNRFYQPDINVEELEVERSLQLSTSSELPLRLRWLAILSAQRTLPLAISGGVHETLDVIRALMAGATVVQLVSTLLRNGPSRLVSLRGALERWLVEREYTSVRQLRGSMNLKACPDPSAYERANYIHLLHGWREHPGSL